MSGYAAQDTLNKLVELVTGDRVTIKTGIALTGRPWTRIRKGFHEGTGDDIAQAIAVLHRNVMAAKNIERVKRLKPGDRFTLAAEPPFPPNQQFVVIDTGPLVVTYEGPAYRRKQATLDWAAEHFLNMETPTGWEPVK